MSLKVLIVGAGKAGSDLHLKAYRALDDIEVTGICDVNIEQAVRVSRDEDIPSAFSTIEEAFKKESFDVVSICTPPSTHFELGRFSLEHGSSTIVEKPIFQTVEEALDFQKIIDQTGGKFSAIHNKKFSEGMLKAKTLFDEDHIGRVFQADYTWMHNGNNNRMTSDPDFWCHTLPGGRWQEMIAHPIYMVYQFVGPMQLRHVELKNVTHRWPWLPAEEVDIALESELGYVNIKLSPNTEKYNFLLLYGSKQVLYVDHRQAADLIKSMRGYGLDRFTSYLSGGVNKISHGATARFARHGLFSGNLSPHGRNIQAFIDYVRGETESPPVSWDEAFNTLELTLEIGEEIQKKGVRAD